MKNVEVKENGKVIWSYNLGEHEQFIPKEELKGDLFKEAFERYKLTRLSSKSKWLGIIVYKSGKWSVVHMDDRKRDIRKRGIR